MSLMNLKKIEIMNVELIIYIALGLLIATVVIGFPLAIRADRKRDPLIKELNEVEKEYGDIIHAINMETLKFAQNNGWKSDKKERLTYLGQRRNELEKQLGKKQP